MLTRNTIRGLREAGVLVKVEGHQLDPNKTGLVLVTCGDCDRTPESEVFIQRAAGHERIHKITLNGAPLRIATDSPLNDGLPADQILMNDIAGSCAMKGLSLVVVCGHYPCGKGAEADLSVEESLDLTMAAKIRIKAEVPALVRDIISRRQGLPQLPYRSTPEGNLPIIKVAVFMHYDFSDTMRTFFVPREAWEAHRARRDGRSTVIAPSLPPLELPEVTDLTG